MIEFRSGRKVVKTVSSVDAAHTLARRLIEARNTDSFWEPNDREGLPVFGIMDSIMGCLLYTSPSPRDVEESRMPSSA